MTIVSMEGDQVAAAAVIGTKNELVALQLDESRNDVACLKLRAIATNQYHLLVSERSDSFDRILKTFRKAGPSLRMQP